MQPPPRQFRTSAGTLTVDADIDSTRTAKLEKILSRFSTWLEDHPKYGPIVRAKKAAEQKPEPVKNFTKAELQELNRKRRAAALREKILSRYEDE